MIICQTGYWRSKNLVKFSATTIPACWHMSELTGFKKDILRTNRVKDMAKIILRKVSNTLPSLGTLNNPRFFDLKKSSMVSV